MTRELIRFFLSRWFFVVFFIFGLIYFVAFPIAIADTSYGRSFVTTLALMTGSDPYTFKDTIEANMVIWGLAWLIHIGSWLLIPALISLVVTNIAEDIKNEQRLQRGLRDFFIQAGVKKEDLDALATKSKAELDRIIKDAEEKGE
jgi:hypothetical protein